jgi:predicted amidohydrolase YtcJ
MRYILVVGIMAAALSDVAPAGAQKCTPDVVILNAKVHTVDASRPAAEAIAVCGATIGQVGSSTEIRALASSKTRVIDAGGRLVVPGFNDAHVHLIDGAEELIGVDLRPSVDVADMARRLGAHAAKLPKQQWIVGGNWDHEAWPTRALPTRQAIDAATPDHPVFVQRLDGHMALANSLALKLAGVTRDTAAPEGGTIVRDAAGEPTGVLKDNAMGLVSRVIPPDSADDLKRKARAALRLAASLGVTTIQDMTNSPRELQTYRELRDAGELSARIYSIQNYSAPMSPAGTVAGGTAGGDLRGGCRRLSAGSARNRGPCERDRPGRL